MRLKILTSVVCVGLGIAASAAMAMTCDERMASGQSLDQLIDAGCYQQGESRALQLIGSASSAVEQAGLHNDLGFIHEKLGHYDQAKQDYARALTLFGDDPQALSVKMNLAAVFYRKGEFQAARAAYQEVVDALDESQQRNPELQSAALGGLGLVMQSIGDYAAAKHHLERTLRLDTELFGRNHEVVAVDLSNLGDVHRSLNEYDQALPIFEQALAIRRKVLDRDHPDIATSLNKLGYVLEIFGQYEKALAHYREALAIRERSLPAAHPHIAVALFSVAEALRRLGRNEEAMKAYQRSLRISEQALPAQHPDIGRTLHYLGQLQFSLGQVGSARTSLQRAIDIRSYSLGPSHALTADSMSILGSYLARSTNVAEQAQGERLMARAFGIALNGGEPGVIVDTGQVLMKFYALQGKRERAIFYGKQSVNMMQRIRGQSRSLDKGLQKSLVGKNEDIYKQLSSLLIDSGRLAEAQQVMAMLKEEEYFDYIQRDSQEQGLDQRASMSGTEEPWAERYGQISGKLAGIGRELAELRKKQERQALGKQEQARLDTLEQDLEVANLAFDKMLGQLITGLENGQVVSDKVDDIGARQGTLAELGSGTVLLQYLILNDRLSILLTTPTIRLARESSIGQAELNRLVARYRDTLRDPRLDPSAQGQALYRLLIAPVAADLQQAQAKVIMLSLDGALRYLPFAALYDGEHYLMEHYALALYNEAAADKLKDKNAANWKVWGLGVTQAHPGFKALHSVKGELDGIVSQKGLSGQALLDQAFDESALKSGVTQKYPVLHIASHFKFTPGTLSDSYLLMGTGGHLTLQDVKVKHNFFGVDLVTLSACETGFGGGQDATGREVEGLGAIMQKKGAKAVMATLWPVEDSSTAQLMRDFYRVRQQQHLNKAEALRMAQRALLEGGGHMVAQQGQSDERGVKRVQPDGAVVQGSGTPFQTNPQAPFSHPYFWAPFILMGNWL